jgi:ABC-type glycerol-3-phosphate transport system substrate-binding protein
MGDGFEAVKTGVVKDISREWNALPDSYKSQFASRAVDFLKQDGKVWGIPLTATTAMLYRNLNVLEQCGIDTGRGIADWNEWITQMEIIKSNGFDAMPDYTVDGWGVLNFVGGIGGVKNDIENGKTTLAAAQIAAAYDMMKTIAPYCSSVGLWDQAAKDLFFDNQMAFYLMGIWEDPSIVQAEQNNRLRFDRIPVPGQSADRYGGINSGEFVGITTKDTSGMGFEFAKYLCDEPQARRVAEGIGRFTYNEKAMTGDKIMTNPLIAASLEAVKGGMPDAVYFQPFVIGTRKVFADGAADVVGGKKTAATAAAETIDGVNLVFEDSQ